MKRTAIYLLIVFAFAGTAFVFSQNDLNRKDNNVSREKFDRGISFVEAHIAKLKQDVTLTAEQEKEIRKLLDKFYKNREQSAKKADRAEQLKNKRLDYDAYVAARDSILTSEQRLQFMEKQEERHNNQLKKRNHENNNN